VGDRDRMCRIEAKLDALAHEHHPDA